MRAAVIRRFRAAQQVISAVLSALVAATCLADGASPAATSRVDRVPADPAKETKAVKEHRSGSWSPNLTDAEKETLFAIAADTLRWRVTGNGAFDFSKYTITDRMKTNMATFVTLKIGDRLRGCIGSLEAYEPLYQSVHHNAVNASRDSRFPRPVQAEELPAIRIHVSILSPMVRISSLDEFKLGEHGIIMQKGGAGAVYLPEVALEQKWNRDETLSSLSEKAGLSRNAWRQGAGFKVFSSVVLEKD